MRRTFFGLVVSAAMMGTLVAAQDSRVPSPGQSQTPTPRDQGSSSSSSSMSSKTTAGETTVTGCLVQGSSPNVFLIQDARATTGSTTTPSSSSSYSSGSAASQGAESNVAGAGGNPDASNLSSSTQAGHMTYVLESATGATTNPVDFKANLNHRVSIVGTAEAKAMPVTKAGDKQDEKKLPKFTAKSVLSLADTCSAAG